MILTLIFIFIFILAMPGLQVLSDEADARVFRAFDKQRSQQEHERRQRFLSECGNRRPRTNSKPKPFVSHAYDLLAALDDPFIQSL
jgi:hypothetical protein